MTVAEPGEGAIPGASQPPIHVLIVASWFPAYDDPAAGRFVADQAEALAATGVARVSVASFDPARLSGGASSRGLQARAVLRSGAASVAAAEPLFVTRAWGNDPDVPVTRLTIPDGMTPDAGPAHGAVHREALLGALGRRLLAEGRMPGYGVVHAHTVYPDGAAAVALADLLGWPLIVTEHSSFVEKIASIPAQRERYAATLGRAFRTFAVSEMLAGELRAAFPEQAGRIDVLPNAVPLALFPVGETADRVADELLFVGYRKTTKGIENLLRAVAVARQRRPSISLRLLGRSPDVPTEARWLALVEELDLAGAVAFEDPVDRAEIAAAMRRASLFVHPSPRETFGVVAVEALASGLPVVATDSGGVSEILGAESAALGAIVPVDDPEALGDAIVHALGRRDSFEPATLRAAVERRFRADFIAERLLVTYRGAIAGTAAGASTPGANTPPETPPAETVPGETAPPTIVVGLDRERAAARLAPLPPTLRETLTLLTASEPADMALPAVGRIIEVDVETDWRPKPPPGRAAGAALRRSGLLGRLIRLATDPRATIARRLGRGAGSRTSLAPATDALVAIAAGLGDRAEVLPLDGHDHLAAEPILRTAKARLAAGGLRRLADVWHASSARTDGRADPT